MSSATVPGRRLDQGASPVLTLCGYVRFKWGPLHGIWYGKGCCFVVTTLPPSMITCRTVSGYLACTAALPLSRGKAFATPLPLAK